MPQETVPPAKNNPNSRKSKVVDFFIDVNLGFLTLWAVALGVIAGFVASSLLLFSLLIGAAAITTWVIGRFSETRMMKKVEKSKIDLQTKINDLEAEVMRLRKHCGLED